MNDLQARFIPQFIDLARGRIARGIDVATRNDHQGVGLTARELHALAGEAGLLGLPAIVSLARDSEDKARRMQASQSSEDAAALVAALRELGRVIELVEPTPDTKGPT